MPAVNLTDDESPAQLFEVPLPSISRLVSGAALLGAGALVTAFVPGTGKVVGLGAAGVGVFLLATPEGEEKEEEEEEEEEEPSPLLAEGPPYPTYGVSVVR